MLLFPLLASPEEEGEEAKKEEEEKDGIGLFIAGRGGGGVVGGWGTRVEGISINRLTDRLLPLLYYRSHLIVVVEGLISTWSFELRRP